MGISVIEVIMFTHCNDASVEMWISNWLCVGIYDKVCYMQVTWLLKICTHIDRFCFSGNWYECDYGSRWEYARNVEPTFSNCALRLIYSLIEMRGNFEMQLHKCGWLRVSYKFYDSDDYMEEVNSDELQIIQLWFCTGWFGWIIELINWYDGLD